MLTAIGLDIGLDSGQSLHSNIEFSTVRKQAGALDKWATARIFAIKLVWAKENAPTLIRAGL
ncbi:MAG: hypothetical protein V4805_08015 [Pseudomonadota bacterium]